MRVKKYVAKTMPEAMQVIRKELGPNVVILHSKEVKKRGFLGLFQQKGIEVIVALDEESIKEPLEPEPAKIDSSRVHNTSIQHNEQYVVEEIKHLQQLIQDQAFTTERNFPPKYEQLYQFLLKQELDTKIALNMVQAMVDQQEFPQEVAKEDIIQQLETELMNRLQQVPFEQPTLHKQIIQFVGPTGVGKTTTLAKIAAKSILMEQKKVAFVTLDTYRIAAIEQLKTYARILDIPLEVAYTLEDYKSALEKYQHYNHIFVDTAGRNFREVQYIYELKKMIDFEKANVETFLVLSLTAKASDISDIYSQFKDVHINRVIFTKVDETASYGSILNICLGDHMPVLYLSNGQNVPDDLVNPNPAFITNLLISRYRNDRPSG